MTINQAWKAVQTEGAALTNSIYNGMFDIDFINGEGCTDEVQFTVTGEKTLEEVCKELHELFQDFCKENNLSEKSVTSITYLGRDPYYEKDNSDICLD